MESTDLYALVEQDRAPHLVELLEMRGIDDAGIAVRPASPGRYVLHDERFYEEGVSGRRGGILGVLGGVVVGLLIALAAPAIDTWRDTLITMVVLMGFGAVAGTFAGIQRAEPLDDDPVSFREVAPDDNLALLEVHHEHWNRRAHRVLQRYGVTFVQTPRPT